MPIISSYAPAMPPKSSLTTTFSASDTNEVVCPLMNQDGTNCRKRCIGVSALCSWSWPVFPPSASNLHETQLVLTINQNTRKNDIVQCKSIYEERIPSITYPSFLQTREASSSWSKLLFPKDLNLLLLLRLFHPHRLRLDRLKTLVGLPELQSTDITD